MKIPYQQLSGDALQGVIEEYITREGTDYGEQEYSLSDKISQVYAQLQRGEVEINFDAETETCTLVRKG